MKSKFIRSAIILMIGGFITKILGLLIKIVTNRTIGVEGIGLYMLIVPTFLLFINISQMGFPIAVSKVVAENKKNEKSIIFSIIPIALLISISLIIIILLFSPLIAKLLHNPKTYYPLLSIGLTLPFISISGIIRGYFFGKEKMIPHTISNIFEQIVRLLLIIFITPIMLEKSIEFAVSGIVLFNILSEITSIIILYFFLPKKINITKKDLKPDKEVIRDVLNISIPATGSRLIGSIEYFFEPIVLTFFLLNSGYTSSYIVREYGIITGFVLPLLMIPSFFTQAISSALLPVISKAYTLKKYRYIKTKIKQSVAISLSIGIVVTIALMLRAELFMNLIYNTSVGVQYIKITAPFFLVFYIQMPLVTALQAMNKAKTAMINSLIGVTIKITLLIILSNMNIGLHSLIISTIVSFMFVTFFDYKSLRLALRKQN